MSTSTCASSLRCCRVVVASDTVRADSYGAFHFAQVTIPLMLEAGGGFLGITGATAALKG